MTLVRGPFPPLGTHWVKRHPAADGLLTCGDPTEFADAPVEPGLEAAPVGRSGARQARAVVISGLSHLRSPRRSRACLAIVHPGGPVGPGRGAAAHPPRRPPAGLPPPTHP